MGFWLGVVVGMLLMFLLLAVNSVLRPRRAEQFQHPQPDLPLAPVTDIEVRRKDAGQTMWD